MVNLTTQKKLCYALTCGYSHHVDFKLSWQLVSLCSKTTREQNVSDLGVVSHKEGVMDTLTAKDIKVFVCKKLTTLMVILLFSC